MNGKRRKEMGECHDRGTCLVPNRLAPLALVGSSELRRARGEEPESDFFLFILLIDARRALNVFKMVMPDV
jgi:hypothetical protein